MKASRSAWFLFTILVSIGSLQAQVPTVVMADGSQSYCNADFFDPGGGGPYPANGTWTLTLCPGNVAQDPTSVSQVSFFDFDLGPGELLYIYAGPDTNGDLIAVGSAGNSLAGTTYSGYSWYTGCLTLVFMSDGAIEGAGWTGLITCSTPCTPPTAVVAPTGYLEVCQNTALTVDGSASVSAYPITDYVWQLPPGATSNGATADLNFTEGGEFNIQLMVMDALGCVSQSPGVLTVRVPTAPDFVGTTLSDDRICMGEELQLQGTVNGHPWSNTPENMVVGETPLPDGGNVSHSSPIQVTGITPGSQVLTGGEILQVCMVIEHSFLGDLSATLTAPGGQQVQLFNGFLNGGSGTYMGAPLNMGGDGGIPGTGAQYCFSMAAPFSTLLAENANGNWVVAGTPPYNSMTPGEYLPESPFSSLIGSDLNGGWILTLTDHQIGDDGFIFEWWLDIDPALFQDVITFTPTYPTQTWTGPDVSATAADGSATATPTVQGELEYVFSVVDDFGCPWDTTITVQVDPPSMDFLEASVTLCDDATAVDLTEHLDPEEDGAVVPTTGEWTGPGGGAFDGTFDPGSDASGLYTYVIGEGTQCESTGTVEVTTQAQADAGGDVALVYCSVVDPVDLFDELGGTPSSGGTWWLPDSTEFDGTLDLTTMSAGLYWYVVPATAPCEADTAFVTVTLPVAADAGADSAISVCRASDPFSMRGMLAGTPDDNGTWLAPGGTPVDDLLDPATAVSGNYLYAVPAVLPCPAASAMLSITFDDPPVAGTGDTLRLCANALLSPLSSLLSGSPDPGGVWTDPLGAVHDGVLDPSLEVSGDYLYVVTGPGACSAITDSAWVHVIVDPLPDISFTVEPDSGCHPLNVVLTNTTDPEDIGAACIWTLGDGTEPFAECGMVEHLYQEPGLYHVKLKITSPLGCTDELLVQGAVLVDPAPEATLTWTPNPGTPENSMVVFTALDPYATVFHWNFEGGDSLSGRQVVRYYPHVLSDEFEVCLDVMDRYGCADTACVILPVVVPSVFVPNTFTPNGDGHNDVFMPFLDNFAKEDFIWRIFDRWGHVVFETSDPGEAWTGEHKSGGGLLPDGVYVWKLSARPIYSPDVQEHNGIVTLLK